MTWLLSDTPIIHVIWCIDSPTPTKMHIIFLHVHITFSCQSYLNSGNHVW